MNSIDFAYTGDEDKSYGLSGMAISLEVLDEQDMLAAISLEPDQDSISFTPDFYFIGNPRFSAKIAWNEMLKQYQLLTSMVIGNVLCRYTVHRNARIDQDTVSAMHAIVEEEGREYCELEQDEIDMVFDKTLRYLLGVYSDSRVHRMATRLATRLIQSRTLTGSDIHDELKG